MNALPRRDIAASVERALDVDRHKTRVRAGMTRVGPIEDATGVFETLPLPIHTPPLRDRSSAWDRNVLLDRVPADDPAEPPPKQRAHEGIVYKQVLVVN